MKNFILTVADLVLYTVAVVAVSAFLPTADFSLPWWGALVAPALVYTLLVVICCPRASTLQAIGIVAVLFVAHAVLASATGMVYAAVMALPYPAAFAVAAWEYLPAPLLQLFCVSLLVLPFRAMYAPRRARRRGSVSASLAVAVAAAAAEPRLEGFPVEMPETAPAPLPEPSVPAVAAPEPSSPSPISGGAPRGGERVEEVISIPFSRIADQLPAGAFTIPPDRLGVNLLEPGHLLVPTRLVVPQLADGVVSVSWDEVADQFPRHALAVNEATMRDRLPEGRIVLPLDEVVRRLPPEMFAASTPAVDVQGIERFPLPFRPFESDTVETVESPPAPPAPAAAAALPSREPVVEAEPPAPLEHVAESPAPRGELEAETPLADSTDFVPSFLSGESEIEYGLVPPAAFEEQLDAIESEPVEPAPAEVHPVAPPPLEPAFIETELSAMPAPIEPPVFEAPRPTLPLTEDRLRQSRNLAAVLTPFGALEVASTSIEGVTLFTFNSSVLPTASVLRTAASTLPFLMSGRAPWTVDQLTVRRERGAIILTPLGTVDSGGPVMVASVGRVGSLAMLELVCLKAAREHRLAYPAPPARRERSEGTGSGSQYETRDSGALSLGFLAGDLNAFGRVAPTVLRDSAGGAEVCVFLAPGEDSRAVAGFSVDVCRALTREGDEPALGALQESVGRPGLAHRQLERAAVLLRTA